jgi:sec-independent protein translocase protein TatC
MTRRETKFVIGFVVGTVPLFLGGVFAGWAVLPHIVELMNSFVPTGSSAYYDARYYLEFVLKLMLATGVAFVLPSILVLLNFLGILTGKSILKGWRWAVLTIGLFAAIATPAADISSMLLLAIPMVALYFSAVGVTTLRDARLEKKERRMALAI